MRIAAKGRQSAKFWASPYVGAVIGEFAFGAAAADGSWRWAELVVGHATDVGDGVGDGGAQVGGDFDGENAVVGDAEEEGDRRGP